MMTTDKATRSSRKITPEEVLKRLPGPQGERSGTAFRHGTLEVKLAAPRGTNTQTPHTRDEVYVVLSGRGWLRTEGAREPFVAGDLLFVPAGLDHRFEDFSDDLSVWVLFYGPDGGEIDVS